MCMFYARVFFNSRSYGTTGENRNQLLSFMERFNSYTDKITVTEGTGTI